MKRKNIKINMPALEKYPELLQAVLPEQKLQPVIVVPYWLFFPWRELAVRETEEEAPCICPMAQRHRGMLDKIG